MKLFKPTSNEKYLTHEQWKKVFLAVSIITLSLYLIAMVCSLCGLDYFIFSYKNEWTDKVESFLREHYLYNCLTQAFNCVEYIIVSFFIMRTRPKWWCLLIYFALPITISFIPNIPPFVFTLINVLLTLILCLIQTKFKEVASVLKRYCIALICVFLLEAIIYAIKSGTAAADNHILTLVSQLSYSLELDLALSVILLTIAMWTCKGKEREKSCQTFQDHGLSSQTSKKQSQKSKWKNLSKKTKRKLAFLYTKVWVIQLGGFILLMVLPFLFGKVFEFLFMYLCFAIVRYILGFKYSLHYNSEMLCISVGVIVFGFLTLFIPSFTIDLVLAVLLGMGLAILLHLSYKFKSRSKFMEKVDKDRFATLYVIFNGNLENDYIRKMSFHYGLSKLETDMVIDYANGEKISYMCYKYNYGKTRMNELLDSIIEKLAKTQ